MSVPTRGIAQRRSATMSNATLFCGTTGANANALGRRASAHDRSRNKGSKCEGVQRCQVCVLFNTLITKRRTQTGNFHCLSTSTQAVAQFCMSFHSASFRFSPHRKPNHSHSIRAPGDPRDRCGPSNLSTFLGTCCRSGPALRCPPPPITWSPAHFQVTP